MVTPEDLQKVPIFACLEPKDRERLARKAADVHLSAGEWLIREGEQRYFFVLLEGEMKMVKDVLGRLQEIVDQIGETSPAVKNRLAFILSPREK